MKRTALTLLFAALVLTACAGAQTRSAFDKTLEKYNNFIRWSDIDRAVLLIAPGVSAELGKRVEDAKKAKIFDYQVIDVKYDKKRREATALVVYSYYTYTTGEVKKITDNQKWVYTSENGGGWRLQSLLPEFR